MLPIYLLHERMDDGMTMRILLVHGILNARWWLLPLALRLRAQGFEPVLFGYPSMTGGPQVAVPQLVQRLAVGDCAAVVGHSLGGVLALEALRAAPTLGVRRVVCLGSPLRGSGAAMALAQHAWGKRVLGRSRGVLCDGVPAWAGAAQVGVVAGQRGRGLGRLFAQLDAPSDGTVSVMETRLEGLADHCTVDASHSGLVLSPTVARQTAHFLQHGQFELLIQ